MSSSKLKMPSVASVLAACTLASATAFAQFGPPPGPAGPAREVAPWDITGQWVAIVTEDWRFRMVTPPRNDFPGLPLNAAAREIAANWDPARDEAEGNACAYYGVGGLMRRPERLRISWDDDDTLEIQTDAGRQTRTLEFGDAGAAGEPSWQGQSVAEWELHRAGRGPAVNGAIKVVTTNMRPGYLRTNGVPYSGDAVLTEYYDLLEQHDGSQWLVVLSILDDPTYFTTPVITSSNFRRQDDRSGWNPTGCEVPEAR